MLHQKGDLQMVRKNSGSKKSNGQSNSSKALDINTDIKIKKPVYLKDENIKHRCYACGREFKALNPNFFYSNSVFFGANEGYTPICKNCLDKVYKNYIELFSGNEMQAMEMICMQLDWYFSDKLFEATSNATTTSSRVRLYYARLRLDNPETKGKTYVDTIKERANVVIHSVDELDEINANGQQTITKAMFERWGQVGTEDIIALEDHYRMLKKQNPNCDNNQEIFIKDLCYTKLLQLKAFKNGNSTDFEKYTKLYRDTFKQAGLKTVQDDDGSNNNTLGINAAIISQYTPEEFYKDKELYKDFDGLGEYFERHVLRPLRNIEFNDNQRDPEYSIGDNDEEDE